MSAGNYEELYRQFYPKLVAALLIQSVTRADAEDAAQEAFERLLNRGPSRRADDPRAWLFSVARNALRSRWRRVLARQAAVGPQFGERAENLTDDHDVSNAMERMRLVHALRQLSPVNRDALVVFYLLDVPIVEMASMYGVSLGTIKSRLSRGRTELAATLRRDA